MPQKHPKTSRVGGPWLGVFGMLASCARLQEMTGRRKQRVGDTSAFQAVAGSTTGITRMGRPAKAAAKRDGDAADRFARGADL